MKAKQYLLNNQEVSEEIKEEIKKYLEENDKENTPLRGTLGSSLWSPAEGEGNEGFPPLPKKDLESPSSTRLEALVPSRDWRAMTRSPSPRAWRPDFPGTAREAP